MNSSHVEDRMKPPSLQKTKCIVENVCQKQNKTGEPLLVSFSNGKLLDTANLKGTLFHNISKDKRHNKRKIFVVNTPKLNYVGKNYGAENYSSSKESIYIGVFDKFTGKMKLVESSSFLLQPELHDVHSTNLHLQKSELALSYVEKQQQVANSFGSKFAKQKMNRMQQNRVNTASMAHAIDQASSAVPVDMMDVEIEDTEEKESCISVLPECNRSAKAIEDVYKLEAIIPHFILSILVNSANKYLDGTEEPNNNFSLLSRELITFARMEQDAETKKQIACVALYIEYLIEFLRLKAYELRGDILKECPGKIRYHILNGYSKVVNRKRIRNRESEDRAVCSVLILAFIVNKYELSVSTVLQSLPLQRERLDTLMKVIGAHKESSIYKLRIPLVKLAKEGKRSKRR